MLTILAQTTDTTETASAGGSAVMLIVWAVVIGGLFWFMLIRPQRTRSKRQQVLQSALEVGTEVHTIGGIVGTIEYMDDTTAVLQLEGGGRMRVLRKAIAAGTAADAGAMARRFQAGLSVTVELDDGGLAAELLPEEVEVQLSGQGLVRLYFQLMLVIQ